MKIHIDIKDDIDPVEALIKLQHVIELGKTDAYGECYNYLNIWEDKTFITCNKYVKSDTFVINIGRL